MFNKEIAMAAADDENEHEDDMSSCNLGYSLHFMFSQSKDR